MGTTLWFHIGERIGLGLDLPRRAALLERFYGSTFEYYRRPHLARDAEVRLTIGKFQPRTPPGAKTVNKEFVVGPGYIYWKGHHGRGATEIVGLEAKTTHIRHMPYREFGPRMLIPGFRAIGLYVEPLLKYHLARHQNTHLLHGGAVARDGRAVVFFGPNGVHKTRLILTLCRRYGFTFLGDDLIMLAGRQVLPLIEHERVLKARFAALDGRDSVLRANMLLVRALLRATPVAHTGLRIGPASELALAVMLDRQVESRTPGPGWTTNAGRVVEQEIGWENLWQRINALERMELIKHQARHRQLINCARLLMAYEFGVPGSHIFRYLLMDDRPVPAGLPEVACRHLALPDRFDMEIPAAVNRLIDESWPRPR